MAFNTVTYLITFACYGCHLHGDERGSVDREHNLHGFPVVESDPKRVATEERRMDQPPYELDDIRRAAVLASFHTVSNYRGWALLAAHVRSNHVHAVVDANVPPERVMNDLKSYASRSLNQLRLDEPGRKRWARHGSTRWLWRREHITAAVRYVVCEQGDPMAVFEAPVE